MARRRSFTGPRLQRSQRRKQWIGPADQSGVAVASGASVIISGFAPDDAFMLQPTLIRSRGSLFVSGVSTADVSATGAFGGCIVSDEAFAAGTLSIPRPFDDSDWNGWFVWQAVNWKFEFISGVGALMYGATYEIDSKAMRKMGTNETLVFIYESQAGAVTVNAITRELFLMS